MSGRLNVIVRLRELAERQAQKDLADVRQRVEVARARLDSLRQPMFDGDALGVEHLIALRAQGVLRAEELADARETLAASHRDVNDAVAAMQAATGRRRAAESLQEQRRLAHAAVAARAAQQSLDEIVVARRAWLEARESSDV